MDYILVVFLMATFFAILPMCLLFSLKTLKHIKIAFIVLLICYCVILFFGVFSKVELGSKITIHFYTINKNAKRFFNFSLYTDSVRDVIINTTMFVPFGFYVCSLFKEYAIMKTVITGIATSTFIEISQYFLPGVRSAQFSDIIMNIASCLIGALAFSVFYIIRKRIRHE